MKYSLLFEIRLFLSCSTNNPVIVDGLTVDNILDINATNKNFTNHLDGEWNGYYQSIDTRIAPPAGTNLQLVSGNTES